MRELKLVLTHLNRQRGTGGGEGKRGSRRLHGSLLVREEKEVNASCLSSRERGGERKVFSVVAVEAGCTCWEERREANSKKRREEISLLSHTERGEKIGPAHKRRCQQCGQGVPKKKKKGGGKGGERGGGKRTVPLHADPRKKKKAL